MIRIRTDAAPQPVGPYSQGIIHAGVLYSAGQGPFDAHGVRVGDTFAQQLEQTFANLARIAETAGTDLRHALRIGVYLSSMDYFGELNALAPLYLTEPFPARTTIVADLPGFDVEIDAVFAVPE
jgi:Putative translation initiation inhibitor, yjgF family